MALRRYDTSGGEWEVTDEPCLNCGEPVYKQEIVGINADGARGFGTAYACPACNWATPSRKPLEEFERMRREAEASADSPRTDDH